MAICENQSQYLSQSFLDNFLLPFVVAVVTYLLVAKLDDWKQKRSLSRLGEAILETLIEEVKNGLAMLQHVASTEEANLPLPPLPRRSWTGMNTIPDDVLLRIIEVSRKVEPIGFAPKQIRTHCKNYFEHMCYNWDNVLNGGDQWKQRAQAYLGEGRYIEATQKVLDMLEQSKKLLSCNATKWFPK